MRVGRSFFVLALVLAACSREPRASAPAPAPVEAPPAPLPEGARASEPQYTVELRPMGTYAMGREGAFEVVLTLQGAATLDENAPTSVSLRAPTGLGLVVMTYGLRQATERGPRKLRFVVPLRPTQNGQGTVEATFGFGFCEGTQCQPRTARVQLDLLVE